MTLQQYVRDAVVTESRLTDPISVDIQRFHTLLNLFIATGNLLDVMKKDIFYGLPVDPVKLEMRTQRIMDNEARVEAAAIQVATQPGNNPQPLTNVDSRLTHAIIGLSTEAVELCEALMASINSGNPIDGVNVLEEIGDLAWYTALMVDTLGADWDKILETNIAKLKKRYKNKFDAAEALDRNLDVERSILESLPANYTAPGHPPAFS